MERGCGRTLSRASCDALLRVRRDLFLGPARTCEPAPGRAAGSWARDMPRLPCFPRALGRCLFRRCCLWLEASKCSRSASEEVPGLVARAPSWRSGMVVLDQSPLLTGPPRALGNKGAHPTPRFRVLSLCYCCRIWFWAKSTRLRVEPLCTDPQTTHISLSH